MDDKNDAVIDLPFHALVPTVDLARRSIADLVSAGRAAIEQAGSFAEVKIIANKAEALRVFQRSIGASQTAVNAAAELRIRAERRMGEELAKAELAKGAAEPGTDRGLTRSASTTASPTLAEIGISKDQSSRYQHLAAIPTDAFEAAIGAHTDATQPISAASVARVAAGMGAISEEARKEDVEPLLAAKPPTAEDEWAALVAWFLESPQMRHLLHGMRIFHNEAVAKEIARNPDMADAIAALPPPTDEEFIHRMTWGVKEQAAKDALTAVWDGLTAQQAVDRATATAADDHPARQSLHPRKRKVKVQFLPEPNAPASETQH